MQYQTEVTIESGGEERVYTVSHFPTSRAAKNLARLAKLLGVPFATMMKAETNDINDVIPEAVGVLIDRLDEDDVLALIKDLTKAATYQGQPISEAAFETHFQGRLAELVKLLVEIVKWNYADFLAVLASAGRKALAAKGQPKSASPST